jgi:hypothetical protein
MSLPELTIHHSYIILAVVCTRQKPRSVPSHYSSSIRKFKSAMSLSTPSKIHADAASNVSTSPRAHKPKPPPPDLWPCVFALFLLSVSGAALYLDKKLCPALLVLSGFLVVFIGVKGHERYTMPRLQHKPREDEKARGKRSPKEEASNSSEDEDAQPEEAQPEERPPADKPARQTPESVLNANTIAGSIYHLGCPSEICGQFELKSIIWWSDRPSKEAPRMRSDSLWSIMTT